MSCRPTIGGRLREETSGVDRSQAGSLCWGLDPVKEIGQTCGLNVIMRRLATSNRSVVTAAKLVYSTWEFRQPGERTEKTIYRDRLASESIHVLHPSGERTDVRDRVGAGGSSAFCEKAATVRRSGRGNYIQHAIVLRRRGVACSARRRGGHQSVSGNQPVGEENRSQRCSAAVAVSVEGVTAGGAHEE
jgi:hypothetical protein